MFSYRKHGTNEPTVTVSRDVDFPAVQCELDAEDPDPAFVAPVRSSVLSRQIGAVFPSVGH